MSVARGSQVHVRGPQAIHESQPDKFSDCHASLHNCSIRLELTAYVFPSASSAVQGRPMDGTKHACVSRMKHRRGPDMTYVAVVACRAR